MTVGKVAVNMVENRIDQFLGCPDVMRALADAERSGDLPDEIYRAAADAGLFAMAAPRRHGGLELPLRDRAAVHARVARSSVSFQSTLVVHDMLTHGLTRFGGEPLQQRWLPQLAEGTCLGAFALTEPAGGSNFEQVAATALTDGPSLVLNGRKSWTSSALRAGLFLVFAVGPAGPVAVLVERDTPGLAITPSRELVVFRAAAMGDLHLDDCVVDSRQRMGGVGLGLLRVATGCLSVGRVLIAAGATAVAEATLGEFVEFANRRVSGSDQLASREVVRRFAADAHVRIESARALTDLAAESVDRRHEDSTRHAIVAKFAASDAAVRTAEGAGRLHDAAGLAVGASVLRRAAEARAYSLVEGSNEALLAALGAGVLREGRHAAREES